ncbi:MAG: NAD(P)/FAD-dependent oxidoreductase [bacterium]|nr:NAD(P)/FAD-dependent oxidoreductase [bacterium]MBU1917446.1 NAD(P)/FAD-dependent oxidoreductase [bacterium]
MNRKNHYDVIIVGAGPASMFCAYELMGKAKVLIIDAGRRLEHKACPLTSLGKCQNCKPVCSVLGGMGGSQFYLGTKLSRYPAGKGLIKFVSSLAELESVYEYVDRVLEKHGKLPREYPASDRINHLENHCSQKGLKLKYYNAQKVSSCEMNNIAQSLFHQFTYHNIDCHFREKVVGVRSHEIGYEVTTNRCTYCCDKLIFATGRLGAASFSTLADKLGLEWQESDVSDVEVGIRVETPSHVFMSIDGIHNDIKLKYTLNEQEDVRSFCQDHCGFLTRCYYNLDQKQAFSSIDGYIMGTERHEGKKSHVSNLGIHHRFKLAGGISEAHNIVKRISFQGKPLVQSMGSFLGNNSHSAISIPLSMPDAVQMNINEFIPYRTSEVIKEFIYRLGDILPGFLHKGNAVYAPSFEMGGKALQLNSSFESSRQGLYVLGDATGHFRGALQAMVSGVLVAQAIQNKSQTCYASQRYSKERQVEYVMS